MTFGNLLVGGLVGLVVDASTGALTKYPESVTIILVPQEFGSVADRDIFFTGLSQSFLVTYEEVIGRIKKTCAPEDCAQQLRAVDAGRTAKLTEIEQKRRLAKVRGT